MNERDFVYAAIELLQLQQNVIDGLVSQTLRTVECPCGEVFETTRPSATKCPSCLSAANRRRGKR